MFLHNKYSRWYFSIVGAARVRELSGYTERHHIIPKSVGGSNDRNNIVRLTPREHYICHLLLPRFTDGIARKKMIYARWCMSIKLSNNHTTHRSKVNITSRAFATARYEFATEHAKAMRNGVNLGRTGQPHTVETKLKISEGVSGEKNGMFGKRFSKKQPRSKQSSPEHREKLRHAKLGKPRSEEAKQKIRDGWAKRKAAQASSALVR